MAKHRAESETTLTGIVATRGLLTAAAALAVVGGPAAGMALADETPDAASTAHQESYNGADGSAGRAGADGADGKNVSDDDQSSTAQTAGQTAAAKKERRDQDGKDGKDGQRGQDGADADSSSLNAPALGAPGALGSDAPALGGFSNPFTPVLGNDVGF